MFIERIQLKNFRNYESLDIEFNKNVNIITGNNAQGKTNLLESLFVTSLGKSFRTSRDSELIKFDQDFARVCAYVSGSGSEISNESGNEISSGFGDETSSEINSGFGDEISNEECIKSENRKTDYLNSDRTKIEMIFRKEGKAVKVDDVKIKKISELFENVYIVIFSPEDLKIVKDEPERRRRFINRELSQLKPSYYSELVKYNKIIKQRNAYLKQDSVSKDMLDVWDIELAVSGAKLMRQRSIFIEKLDRISSQIHEKISGGHENLKLEYESNIKISNNIWQESICSENIRQENIYPENICEESICPENICPENICEESICSENICEESICSESPENHIEKTDFVKSQEINRQEKQKLLFYEKEKSDISDLQKKHESSCVQQKSELESVKESSCKQKKSELEKVKEKESSYEQKSVLKEIQNEFLKILTKNREHDIFRRTTGKGPHKDDIKIEVNGIDIRKFGSQGQQRTAALSLKLAEMQLIREETGENPILLLDDVLSELDFNRQSFLINYLKNVQLFITTTEIPEELMEKLSKLADEEEQTVNNTVEKKANEKKKTDNIKVFIVNKGKICNK